MGSVLGAYPPQKNDKTITVMMATSRAISKSFCNVYGFEPQRLRLQTITGQNWRDP